MFERRAKMEAQAAEQQATEQAAQKQSERFFESELVDDDGGEIPQGIPYKRGAAQNLKIFYESVIIDEDDDDYYDDEEYLDDEYDADEYEEKAPNKTLLISEDYDDEAYEHKQAPKYIEEEQEEEIELIGNGYNSAENAVEEEELVEEEPVEEEVYEEESKPVYTSQPVAQEPVLVEEEVEEEFTTEEHEVQGVEEEMPVETQQVEEVQEQPRKVATQQPVKQYDEQGREVKYVVETFEDDEIVKPAKLVKLPNLVDYMISLNMSKRMKMNVCMLLLTAYHKYKDIPQEKTIVISCMRKMLTALLQG
ncbi:MAG: hypothetical protein K2G31_04680 [Clostridia bacterium]|nr:hypothetical protein [Clostridia bacterium]